VEIQPQGQIDLLNLSLGQRVPGASGVAPSGRFWVFYQGPFDHAKLLWTEPDGSTLNVVDYPWAGGTGRLVALGKDGTVYACGSSGSRPGRRDIGVQQLPGRSAGAGVEAGARAGREIHGAAR
jgi:hypothetical protein